MKERDIIQAMEFTEKIASRIGFHSNDRLLLKLITEEACMNAYEYCKTTKQNHFHIYWFHIKEELTILIIHKGENFRIDLNHDEVNYGPRGRGLQLIVNIMDQVDVQVHGEYIEFSMKKYL